jgi:glutaredoxin-like protein NrdH
MPCRATKRQLDKAGAPYTLIDVTEHPEAVDRIRELGYTGTPVVEVQLDDGVDHWQGHREDQVDAAIFLATRGGAA